MWTVSPKSSAYAAMYQPVHLLSFYSTPPPFALAQPFLSKADLDNQTEVCMGIHLS